VDFSVSTILAGLLFGVAGLWLVRNGRREGNLRWAMIGVVLMIYPYFSPNAYVDWGLGFFLCALAYRWRDL